LQYLKVSIWVRLLFSWTQLTSFAAVGD